MIAPATSVLNSSPFDLVKEIGAYGLTVREFSNRDEFEEASANLPRAEETGEALNALFDNDPSAWRWQCSFDENGACVSMQGARLDTLEPVTLRDFISESNRRFFKADATPVGRDYSGGRDLDAMIGGTVVYLHQMYVDGRTSRAYRDKRLAGLLSASFAISLYGRWSPDCCFALIAAGLVRDRFAERCLFHHVVHPGAVPGDPDFYVFNFREDLEALSRHFV